MSVRGVHGPQPVLTLILILIAGAALACTLEPLDHEGRACSTGVCPAGYACVAGLCTQGATAGDAGVRDAAPLGPEEFLVLELAADTDDATWLGNTAPPDREVLSVDNGGVFVEVGQGGDHGTAGLRFALPLPPGAQILDARLELQRLTGGARETNTLRVAVWQSIDVPPFDPSHVHPPEFHAAGGLSAWVGGWAARWDPTTSPDLSALLQPLVARSDWRRDATVGFVIAADDMPEGLWAGFADHADQSAPAARLKLRVRR